MHGPTCADESISGHGVAVPTSLTRRHPPHPRLGGDRLTQSALGHKEARGSSQRPQVSLHVRLRIIVSRFSSTRGCLAGRSLLTEKAELGTGGPRYHDRDSDTTADCTMRARSSEGSIGGGRVWWIRLHLLTDTSQLFAYVESEIAHVRGPGADGDLVPHLPEIFPGHPEGAVMIVALVPEGSLWAVCSGGAMSNQSGGSKRCPSARRTISPQLGHIKQHYREIRSG